ncbi:MAG TPA: ferredoxin--NADP reductase [Candidatus Krumholzibacteria bacterium]|nr:ferredoxin--NADP reductase [Candidatus Krumholzibacteria bacterium]HPD71170.1 ferredoxin--NADP reductase [Candidatus Krumholzibacteria bacterium]HRY39130.1 ferredoxin--NADP reductase [Candidatus Krumholzibacteria bacterium]
MDSEPNATVTMRYEINHGLLVLQVTPDEEMLPFVAGQYTTLGLPGAAPRHYAAEPEDPPADPARVIKRAYSIASSSLQGRYFEFFVALVRTGALTPRLFALEQGDRVFLGRRIVGMFTLGDVPPGKDVVFVATGTGLAPYLSMLRSRYAFDAGQRTVVVHGSRVSYDLGYRSELEGLAARYPSFHYLPIIDRPDRDPGWTGQVGFVDRYFADGTVSRSLGHPITPENTVVFLCGNPLMVQGMMAYLGALGFRRHTRKEPGHLFVEEFWKED